MKLSLQPLYLVAALFICTGVALAQSSDCGSIIFGPGNESPITDCQYPFGVPNQNPEVTVTFGDVEITDGGSYALVGEEDNLVVTGTIVEGQGGGIDNFVEKNLYRQDGVNYINESFLNDPYTFTEPGDYVLVIFEGQAQVSLNPLTDFLFNTAYAAVDDRTIISFIVTGDVLPPDPECEIFDGEGTIEVVDCEDPFNAAVDFPYEVTIASITVEADGAYTFPLDTELPLAVIYDEIGSIDDPNNVELYEHVGDNYRQLIRNDVEDVTTVEFSATGTYTIVIDTRSDQESWLRNISDYLFPTAYAACIEDCARFARTFTVTTPAPEPTGASSVLFLPGIQASRLYFGDGEEVFDKVWEPGENADIETLALDQNGGNSLDIRTNDIVDEVALPFIGQNIYKGFANFMDDLVDDEIIAEWSPFAYDWRYDVFDIVDNGTKYLDGTQEGAIKNPIAELAALAADSKSGQVTIIAHSNGGLLAKAIMIELEAQGRVDLVDKIIFIGTPHLGTPKAIGTVLHGYDQEAVGGLIVDDAVARRVIKNLPGVYSLLPSEAYFDAAGDPLVVFDDSPATAALRDYYGFGVTTFAEFTDFLTGAEDPVGRAAVSDAAVNEPTTANGDMLDTAISNHADLLDAWLAPEVVDVYQIVGTGLPTMKAIEYRGLTETVCDEPTDNSTSPVCLEQDFLKPYAQLTRYGDETVVSLSGAAYVQDNVTYYLDLNEAKKGLLSLEKNHSDLTESIQVQELTQNLLLGNETAEVEFTSNTEPQIQASYDIEVIDSPVAIYTTDSEGNVTGLVAEGGELVRKREIPGSRYFEFGGSKYLITPSEIDRTTTLMGLGFGSYTLTVAQLGSDDTQNTNHVLKNASTTPTMVATYSKTAGEFSTVTTDSDGDGVPDTETTLDGEVVTADEVTYDDLLAAIQALDLNPGRQAVLVAKVKLMDRFAKQEREWLRKITERTFRKTLNFYHRKGWITAQERQTIIEIIDKIKS